MNECVCVFRDPVVAPCDDMLPYIPILIHHLWNVRKCVVSRGLAQQQQPPYRVRAFLHTCQHAPLCFRSWRGGVYVSVCGRTTGEGPVPSAASTQARVQLAILPGIC